MSVQALEVEPAKSKAPSRPMIYAAAIVGLVIVLFQLRDGMHYLASGQNDYLQLYAGARLVASSKLYDPQQSLIVQMQSAGFFGESLEYTRPPFYAALLWPLGKLPYSQSYFVWQVLSICALLAFIMIWRIPSRDAAVVACCWSLPLILAIQHGQDVMFLLVIIAISLRIYPEQPFLTGVVLSLCAIKFHLFLLLPLVIIGQKRWRILGGLLTGAAALVTISFAAGGADWPQRYLEILALGRIEPQQQIMPNFHGLMLGSPYRPIVEPLLGLITVSIVWRIARRTDFEYGMAAALAGGLLISYHAYPQDCTLLLPALLIVLTRSFDWRLNYLVIALLTPWPYLILIQGDSLKLVPVGIALLLVGMMFHRRKTGSQLTAATVG
jgi:alpha-1,2-mannosyltransferase